MFSRCGIRLSQGMQGFGGREGNSHRCRFNIICSYSSVLCRASRGREQEIEELWPTPGLALKLTSPPLTHKLFLKSRKQ